ncbi:hypothetical protein BH24ACT4_BH24ACT4_19680 [soil metagenome]
MGRLDDLDLSARLRRKEYQARLDAAQERLVQLRLHLGGQMGGELGPGLLLIFEGKDAAGKGGAIKRVVERLDPRHYRVDSYSAPTDDEKRHNFLWRFAGRVPGRGGMVVFDRSWYGRVLVERIEGFATEQQWRRAYDEIVQYEEMLAREELIILKFWLHISDEEQAKRFEGRAEDPLKQWKLTDEDWRNRDKSTRYQEAAEEMFVRTDHGLAPWVVVAAEQKRFARITVVEELIVRLEEGMRRWGMEVPEPLTEPGS